jgi:hypothetical protein
VPPNSSVEPDGIQPEVSSRTSVMMYHARDLVDPQRFAGLVAPQVYARYVGQLMTADNALLTAPTTRIGWLPVCTLALLALVCACRRAPSRVERGSVNTVAESHGREVRPASIRPFSMTARLAKFIAHTTRGALWSDNALLGVFEFDSGKNVIVVTMPRDERVACAAWSEDGSLLAAVSSVGSTVLWSVDGTLLSDVPGDSQVAWCSGADFTFTTAVRHVFVTVGHEPARLLGERFAVALASDSGELLSRAFSADGRRLFAATRGERVRVYETIGAMLLKALPGSFQVLPVSANGKFLALQKGDDAVDLYDYDSLSLVQTVAGNEPAFHLDMLIVDGPRADERGPSVVAYGLQPFAKRWERREVGIYDERGTNPTSWRVGGTVGVGYSVFDVRTGETLATWRASGYACGYQWLWEDGTLAFLEGDLLTFWSKGSGAKTHSSKCAGPLEPILSADRSRFIGLDSIWELRSRRRVARLEMPPMGDGVVGFSRDERQVIGSGSVGESLTPQLIAWSAATGRIVWHRDQPDDGERTGRVGWYLAKDKLSLMLVDTTNGHLVQFGNLIDPTYGLQPLVFDEECWAGPETLPSPETLPTNMPTRKCPELWAIFGKIVDAQSRREP